MSGRNRVPPLPFSARVGRRNFMIDEITRPVFATARLVMRPPTLADAPRLARLADDFEVLKHTGGMPFPYTLADAEASVRRARAADPAREAHFAIDLVGEGPIGGLGFYATGGHGPEVGYWLGRAHWGRGLASEMLAAAMAWAKGEWKRSCVVASHHADNETSARVLVKAGFLHTGRVEMRPCRARGCDVASRWMVWLA
jgi:RimJ/RimL family protein N-acetyltransferase